MYVCTIAWENLVEILTGLIELIQHQPKGCTISQASVFILIF